MHVGVHERNELCSNHLLSVSRQTWHVVDCGVCVWLEKCQDVGCSSYIVGLLLGDFIPTCAQNYSPHENYGSSLAP